MMHMHLIASMIVLVVANQKGGASKTTVVLSLAVCAMAGGYSVTIIDIDEQGSALSWGRRRASKPPKVVSCAPDQLDSTLATLRADGTDIVVVDTPGSNGVAVNIALAACDLTLLPCRPTVVDLEGSLPTARALKRLGRPFAYVLTQCPIGERRTSDAQQLLDRLAARAGCPLRYRVDYQDALAVGLGVTEHNRSGAAAREMEALWTWTAARLQLPEQVA